MYLPISKLFMTSLNCQLGLPIYCIYVYVLLYSKVKTKKQLLFHS